MIALQLDFSVRGFHITTRVSGDMTALASRRVEGYRILAGLEAVVAVLCGAFALLLIINSFRAARWAQETYGHNVDSGASEFFVAVTFLAPCGALFAVNSWTLWRRWTLRWWVQGAIVAVVATLLWLSHSA